ncbi:C-X-C motif chemokine 16 [Phascolarctos cinereus]|uniref:C-X-C motif chemokine 16 n=1 Tax=Phascolarctos cinereus TaxID=38626 RepID=A0A6P5IJF4_PHACI|nr:C-X-C motif chemokine 16 [Phascolarctos cinereus]
MAGSSELANTEYRSMKEFWRILLFFLTRSQIVIGNQGSIVGSCPCDLKLLDPPNPTQWQLLLTNLQGYESCHNYIRFRLPRKTLCSSSKNSWVQKLRTCFDNHECRFARTYQSGKQRTQDDYPTTKIHSPKPTGLDRSPPFTTTDPFSQTNQSTTARPTGMRNRYLNDTTSALSGNSSMENLKWEAENGQMDQRGTSATIPVLCLLGIVFVLTGALAYVLCRRRLAVESPNQHPKGKHGIQVFWSHKSQLHQGPTKSALLDSVPFLAPGPSSQRLPNIL